MNRIEIDRAIPEFPGYIRARVKTGKGAYEPGEYMGKDINALIDYAEALEELLEDIQDALYQGLSAETIGAIIHYRQQRLEED